MRGHLKPGLASDKALRNRPWPFSLCEPIDKALRNRPWPLPPRVSTEINLEEQTTALSAPRVHMAAASFGQLWTSWRQKRLAWVIFWTGLQDVPVAWVIRENLEGQAGSTGVMLVPRNRKMWTRRLKRLRLVPGSI